MTQDPAAVLGAITISLVGLIVIVLAAWQAFWLYIDWKERDYDNTPLPDEPTPPPSDVIAAPSAASVRPSVRIRPRNRRDVIAALQADGWALEDARAAGILRGANDKLGAEWHAVSAERVNTAQSATRVVEARRLDGTTHPIELGGAS